MTTAAPAVPAAASAPANSASSEVPSSARRDFLLSVERTVQALWEQHHVFEEDATADGKRGPDDKYFATFPYPYMNGALHLGHAFTLAKADFQCNFQRLLGKRVLFPFGFHCTGMPIAACADKLKRELELYGNPPVFPSVAATAAEEEAAEAEEPAAPAAAPAAATEEPAAASAAPAAAGVAPAKKRAGKAKVAKKASKEVYQWNILKEMGVAESEIALFANPHHWLQYFPPIALDHLKAFGLCADFRRSFITTDVNPYYDAFIRWQFNTLRAREKIAFGARLSIFSPIDNQTCADHDRAEGEGVGITDYTLIKIELIAPYPPALQAVLTAANSKHTHVYLPAATLRPETMYGQTNVFLLPEGEYGVFDMNDTDVFVCSAKSVLNMSYQNLTRHRGKPDQIGTVLGQVLMGCPVRAPLAQYERVYVLPLTTIKMDKGTGVVTSVPSDAPDDYAALTDLKKKPAFREKYGITDEMVVPFEVVPIIETPGLGTQPAVDLCIAEKVASQNDRAKLELIKDKVYKEGFAKGVMIKGTYAGTKVSEAKPKIKADMIAAGQALPYSEPESRVVSRSGNECVVAFSDQWYLKYGEDTWQSQVREHVEQRLQTFNPMAKKDFLTTVDWLHEWACSRSYGLGTFLPWDRQYVIESLSDSTIYMAYYTIAHLLQQGTLDGSKTGPAGITPEQLTDPVFDYVFLRGPLPTDSPVPQATLDRLRAEFEFWYPMDLRVSGKDLIQNHLTMSLYNHAAIWPAQPDMWPRGFFTNGHVMIDAAKMSKSTGNFITLTQAVQNYSADATRLVLADSGDSLEDANFETKNVNAAILKLTKEEAWVRKEVLPALATMRTGPYNFLDRVFDMEMNAAVRDAERAYASLQYRDAIKAAFHDLLSVRDSYRLLVDQLHADLIRKYLHTSILLLAPVCPHFTQHMWTLVGLDKETGQQFVARARWPTAGPIDVALQREVQYLREANLSLRRSLTEALSKIAKAKSKVKPGSSSAVADETPDALIVAVASSYPEWQQRVLQLVGKLYAASGAASVAPERKDVIAAIKAEFGSDKKLMESATKFAQSVVEDVSVRGAAALELIMPFDEVALASSQYALLLREVAVPAANVQVLPMDRVVDANGGGFPAAVVANAAKALPGRPSPCFYRK